MKHFLSILFISCICMCALAQTPYDSFAPETSRPILDMEALSEMHTLSHQSPDTMLCALVIDTSQEQIYLIDVSDGEIIAYAPIIDDIRKWMSVDPLADKYPNISPYAYCGWNPINAIDPDGEEWTDIDGNVIMDHSNIKAYIFYNKEDFGSQTQEMYAELEKKYGKGSVALSDVNTTKEFQQDWKNMASNNIQEVNINHHGSNQAIHLDNKNNQYITSTGTGYTNVHGNPALNVQDLGNPIGNINQARLNLHTCKSNSTTQNPLKGNGLTLMQSFYKTFNFKEVKGTSAGVSYNRFTLRPEPQFFWQTWDYLRR